MKGQCLSPNTAPELCDNDVDLSGDYCIREAIMAGVQLR